MTEEQKAKALARQVYVYFKSRDADTMDVGIYFDRNCTLPGLAHLVEICRAALASAEVTQTSEPVGELKEIPICAAKDVAKKYGYHQIYIIGRRVGDDGIEHVTTYGVDRENCEIAARVGNFLKHKIMGWPEYAAPVADRSDALLAALKEIYEYAGSCAEGTNEPEFSQFLNLENIARRAIKQHETGRGSNS